MREMSVLLCALFDVLKFLPCTCVKYSKISKYFKNEIRYFDLYTIGIVYGNGWLLNVFGFRLFEKMVVSRSSKFLKRRNSRMFTDSNSGADYLCLNPGAATY